MKHRAASLRQLSFLSICTSQRGTLATLSCSVYYKIRK